MCTEATRKNSIRFSACIEIMNLESVLLLLVILLLLSAF